MKNNKKGIINAIKRLLSGRFEYVSPDYLPHQRMQSWSKEQVANAKEQKKKGDMAAEAIHKSDNLGIGVGP